MEHRIVLNENVLTWSIFETRLSGSRLHAYTVVSGVDGVVDNQDILAAADVESIAVLGVPRASYCNVVNYHVVAACRDEVELGRVLKCNVFYEHILAVSYSDEVCAHLFLCLGCGCYVFVMLEVERKPQFASFCLCASHIEKLFPLSVAYFRTLYRTPECAVAVDYAFAGYADVLTLACAYQWSAFVVFLAVFFFYKQALFG